MWFHLLLSAAYSSEVDSVLDILVDFLELLLCSIQYWQIPSSGGQVFRVAVIIILIK